MIQSLYTAVSAMTAHQKNMDQLADNISNVNTTGFKGKTVGFKDALYRTMETPVQESEQNNLQQGHGVLVGDIKTAFTQGSLEQTDIKTDFALEGEGFFAVDSNEEIFYTRDGNFNIGIIDNTPYLVTKEGYYVLDQNRNRIVVYDGENISRMPGVFNFVNPQGLSSLGSNYYETTESSGQAQNGATSIVKQGYLESSNVSVTDQLTRMIRIQRAYQTAARAFTTADEMEGLANNIRR